MRIVGGLGLLSLTLVLAACDKDSATQTPDPNADIQIVETIEEGTGPKVEPGDTAYILYRGTQMIKNAAGTEESMQFDTNWDDVTNQVPMVVQVVGEGERGGMIEGFDQAINRLNVGDHVKVAIPWEKGYGANGSPPKIPPYQDLTFEIKVLYAFKPDESEVFDIVENTPGTGATAQPGDEVEIHYRGTYLTGKMWDDTRERGETAKFTLGDREKVIPGINAGMGGLAGVGVEPMKVGGKRTIIIPHTLAFGPGGSLNIQGNQPLQIEIELVSVTSQG